MKSLAVFIILSRDLRQRFPVLPTPFEPTSLPHHPILSSCPPGFSRHAGCGDGNGAWAAAFVIPQRFSLQWPGTWRRLWELPTSVMGRPVGLRMADALGQLEVQKP